MDFTAGQHLAITKVIVEVTDSSKGSNFVQKMLHEITRFKDNLL